MLDTSRLVVHIGYHKTGSTWLQQMLFPAEETGFRLAWRRADVNEWLVLPKQLVFDPARVRPHFDEAFAGSDPTGGGDPAPACIPVISNERLSGNPHSGGWDSQILADRLHRLFPEARVLAIVREQHHMIRSMYFQYVREGGPASLAQYLFPPAEGRYRVPLFDFEFYAYHRLIEYYHGLFGRERVLVLPYEMLRESPADFARAICSFAGAVTPSRLPDAHPNVAPSAAAVSVKRQLNRFFVRDALNPAAPLPFRHANRRLQRGLELLDRALPISLHRSLHRRLDRAVREAVGERYRGSNRRTAEITGLDLERYGYAL